MRHFKSLFVTVLGIAVSEKNAVLEKLTEANTVFYDET